MDSVQLGAETTMALTLCQSTPQNMPQSTLDLFDALCNPQTNEQDLVNYLRTIVPQQNNLEPKLTALKPASTPKDKPSSSFPEFIPRTPSKHARYHSISGSILNFHLDHPFLGFNLLGAALYNNSRHFVLYLVETLSPQQLKQHLIAQDSHDKTAFEYIFYLPAPDTLFYLQLFDAVLSGYEAFSIHPLLTALQAPKALYQMENRQCILFFMRSPTFNPFLTHPATKLTLLHTILGHFSPLTQHVHLCQGGSKRRNSTPGGLWPPAPEQHHINQQQPGQVPLNLIQQELKHNELVETMVFQVLEEVLETAVNRLWQAQLQLFPHDPLNLPTPTTRRPRPLTGTFSCLNKAPRSPE
jgi:hypothetical protein